jgi:cell pole-organizing protein PopZ
MRHEGEPSVEEILESIKKVIARDNRDTLQAERRRRSTAGIEQAEPVDQDEAEEVLELGEAEAEMPAADAFAPETDDASEPDPSLSTLTTESAARSMRDSLAALAMIAEPGAPPQIVRSGETSLEGLTRDLLRPMLAHWLDQNLPPMVERMVAAEIARIAGKRG